MSIVKEIDKISGTDTRSKNIEDAVKKLELGGGAEYIKLGSTGSFSISSDNWSGSVSVSFSDYKNLTEIVGDKTIIGYFAVYNRQYPVSLIDLKFSGLLNDKDVPIYLWNTYEGTKGRTSALATFALGQYVGSSGISVENADIYLICV